jgi:DNA replication ATP-dependent helicase Dna2
MTKASDVPFHVTPTLVARYFFQDCERYLRYRAAGRDERARSGIPNRQFDHSPLMRAVLESGSRWEEEVVTRLLRGNVAVAPGHQPLPERRFSQADTLDLLRTEQPGRYIYQANPRPPLTF